MSTIPPPIEPSSQIPQPPPNPDIITPPPSPMDPVIVLVLAVFFWGIAYFTFGQWKKGLASLGLYCLLAIFGVITCGWGWSLYAPAWIFTILDSYMQAKTLREGRAIGQWTFFDRPA